MYVELSYCSKGVLTGVLIDQVYVVCEKQTAGEISHIAKRASVIRTIHFSMVCRWYVDEGRRV